MQKPKGKADWAPELYVDKNTEATGRDFNLPGHSKWDLKVIEKVHDRRVGHGWGGVNVYQEQQYFL